MSLKNPVNCLWVVIVVLFVCLSACRHFRPHFFPSQHQQQQQQQQQQPLRARHAMQSKVKEVCEGKKYLAKKCKNLFACCCWRKICRRGKKQKHSSITYWSVQGKKPNKLNRVEFLFNLTHNLILSILLETLHMPAMGNIQKNGKVFHSICRLISFISGPF